MDAPWKTISQTKPRFLTNLPKHSKNQKKRFSKPNFSFRVKTSFWEKLSLFTFQPEKEVGRSHYPCLKHPHPKLPFSFLSFTFLFFFLFDGVADFLPLLYRNVADLVCEERGMSDLGIFLGFLGSWHFLCYNNVLQFFSLAFFLLLLLLLMCFIFHWCWYIYKLCLFLVH